MARFSDRRAQVKAATQSAMMTDDDKTALAMLLPAMFVATADGSLDQAELAHMAKFVAANGTLPDRALPLPDLLAALHGDVSAGDPEELIANANAQLDPAQRAHAIELAIAVACADSDFDIDEQSTLLAIAKNFGIERDQYAEIQQHVIGRLH